MDATEVAASIRRKVQRSLHRRGIAGTLWFFTYRSFWLLLGHQRPPQKTEFDKRFGTDTGGEVKLEKLHIAGENVKLGVPYTGTPVEIFEKTFEKTPMRHENFTFVDLGCGKGLALLLASSYPFRRLIGVEFAPELLEVARVNVQKYQHPEQKCKTFEFVCEDATKYEIPAEPMVFYFANPFLKDVMHTTIQRIERSLNAQPREAWIVYVNPVERQMFDAIPSFEPVERNPDVAVYHYSPK